MKERAARLQLRTALKFKPSSRKTGQTALSKAKREQNKAEGRARSSPSSLLSCPDYVRHQHSLGQQERPTKLHMLSSSPCRKRLPAPGTESA